MNQLLAAIDDTTCARAVLAAAPSIAELFEATAVALHISEDGFELSRRLAADAGVELHEATGAAIETIAAAAESPEVVVVVLGARGEQGGPLPAGRTALKLITRVNKPVVVVPPSCAPRPEIACVLTPLEGSAESSQAIAETLARAIHHDAEIVVVHVHAPGEIPPFQDQAHHQTSAWESEFAARFVTPDHNHVQIIQRVGAPADRILAAAGDTGADLIVLGWNQSLEPGRAAVVQEMLARAPIPVMLLPTV